MDYLVTYSLIRNDKVVLEKTDIIVLDDFVDVDFRDDFIKDKIEEDMWDYEYDEIELLSVEDLFDISADVENICENL